VRRVRNDNANALLGNFAPRAKAAEASEAPAGQAEQPAASESQPEQTNTDPTETRYERARRAFLRNGWKDDEFRKLDRDQAIRRGLKLERQQNRQAAEYARLKTEVDRKGETASDAAAGGTRSGVPSPSAVDRLTELLSKHGLDDDPQLKGEFTSVLSPLLEEIAELKAAVQRSRAEGSEADQLDRMNRARSELSKTFPDIAEDDEFEGLLHTALALKDSPQFAGYDSDESVLLRLLTAAARALDLEQVGERDNGATWSNGSASSGSVDRSSAVVSRVPAEVPKTLERASPTMRRLVMDRLQNMSKQSMAGAR
jgi:hypothetical protein